VSVGTSPISPPILTSCFNSLFLWRREQSSRIYALAVTILTLFTALAPAHVLAKMTYATIGIIYWFITPVILAMPSDALKRYATLAPSLKYLL
jgi:hypothetical protein